MSWQQFGRLLRIVFLLRVPLVTLFLLAAFGPIASSVAEELLGNLLYQAQNPWHFFVVAFSAFLLAFTAIVAINLIFVYGEDRMDDKNQKFAQNRPVLTFVLGSLPAVVLLVCVAQRTPDLPSKFLLSAAGFLAAMGLVILAKFIQLALTDPTATPYPPPYLVFPAYLFPPIQRLFDRAYCWSSEFSRRVKSRFNRLAQWPLEILQDAGQGYLVDQYPKPPEPLRLRSGHVFAMSLAVLAFAFYVGIGYGKAYISQTSARVPALAYLLLFAIVLCWTLSALTFFLDRYGFPLLWLLAVLSLATTFTPISDHFFRTVTLDQRVDHLMKPAELLAQRIATGRKRLVLVATAGGGIQASAWTVQVLTGLEEQCEMQPTPCDFRNSVAAISSVSGGSLGSLVYARSYDHNLPPLSLDEVAWGWTNPDVARVISPWSWNREIDRAWALERKWAEINGLVDTKGGKGDTLLSTWADEAHRGMPALIFNSMIVESGRPVVFTTSDFARKDNGRGLRNFYDLYPDPPYPDVRVNTAVRLSASFPYVGPAARPSRRSPMAPDYHFVDGGYYDNYGINSLLEWLDDALKNDKLRVELRDILIVQIRPFGIAPEPKPSRHGWGFQVSAPVQGLLKMRDTAQDARDATDLQLFARYNASRKVNLLTVRFAFPGNQGCGKPPLSWELTNDQAKCISSNWKTLEQNHDPRIACVMTYLSGEPLKMKDEEKDHLTLICPDAGADDSAGAPQ
jgi:predicted acylesterase/phospholipase RssA